MYVLQHSPPFQDDPLSPFFGMAHFLLWSLDETSIWIFDRYGWSDIDYYGYMYARLDSNLNPQPLF